MSHSPAKKTRPKAFNNRDRSHRAGVDLSIPTDLHTFPCYEFEDVTPQSVTADGSTIVTVQGRLREHFKFWLCNLEASEFVKQIVQFGYRIPFLALPALIFHFNHQSALQNEEFVSSTIAELVKGSISVFHGVSMALENFTCFKFSPLACPQPVMC